MRFTDGGYTLGSAIYFVWISMPGLEAQDVDMAHKTSKNLWPFGGASSLTVIHPLDGILILPSPIV